MSMCTEDQLQKSARAIKLLTDAMKHPSYRERLNLLARDAFARYRACVDAGFTPAQALEMVIRKGIE